jgi:4'-phosphopantetheinyl transferase
MSGFCTNLLPRILEPDAVHVWQVDFIECRDELDHLQSVMSSAECERAARFVNARLQDDYTISHGATRIVLSDYVGVPPRELEFVTGEHGKPSIHPRHGSGIHFNLSHSGTKCLIALTRQRELGVDVERIRPLNDWLEIAKRFFSTRETDQLLSLPEALRHDGFFATWCRKEAYIKAIGMGLALELGSFAVDADPRHEARLLWIRDDQSEPGFWSMRTLSVPSGYHAALAVRGACEVVQHRWSTRVG